MNIYLKSKTKIMTVIAILFVFVSGDSVASTTPLRHVYLTLSENPSNSVVVNVQTLQKFNNLSIVYGVSKDASSSRNVLGQVDGVGRQIVGLKDERWVYAFVLKGLESGKKHYFKIYNGENTIGEERIFHAIDDKPEKLRVVIGGDTHPEQMFSSILEKMKGLDPDLFVVGGDIAYGNGRLTGLGLWDKWFDLWEEYMNANSRGMIPLALAIGNHDVKGEESEKREDAPFYFGFFKQPHDRTYFGIRIGEVLDLLILDTGLMESIDGSQYKWLQNRLRNNKSVKNKIAVYHYPAYPGLLTGYSWETLIRKTWVPLFEKWGVKHVFEHHEHIMKRTYPLYAGVVNESKGVQYLGGGSMGRYPRPIRNINSDWRIKEVKSINHAWVMDILGENVKLSIIDAEKDDGDYSSYIQYVQGLKKYHKKDDVQNDRPCANGNGLSVNNKPSILSSIREFFGTGILPYIRVPQDSKTIKEAVELLHGGGTIIISPGIYRENIEIIKNKAEITLASKYYLECDSKYIDSTIIDGGSGDKPVFTIRQPVKIVGLTIQNGADGLWVAGKTKLFNSIIKGNTDGIDFETGSGHMIADNVFINNRDDAIDFDGDSAGSVVNNVMINNQDDGVEIRLHQHAGDGLKIIIAGNLIQENGEDGVQMIAYAGKPSRTLYIKGNLFIHNRRNGIGVIESGISQTEREQVDNYYAGKTNERVYIANNNFYKNRNAINGRGNLDIFDNIFLANHGVTLGKSAVMLVQNNIFYGNKNDEEEKNRYAEDNLFVDPRLSSDFVPTEKSPAVNAANKLLGDRLIQDDIGNYINIGAID